MFDNYPFAPKNFIFNVVETIEKLVQGFNFQLSIQTMDFSPYVVDVGF